MAAQPLAADNHPHDDDDDDGPRGDWSIRVGAGALMEAVSPGIDEYTTDALPYFEIVYRDRFFLSVERGLGATVIEAGGFRLDAAAGLDMGRDWEDARDVLRGMGDVKESLEATLAASYSFAERFELQLEVAKSLDSEGYKGFRADLSLEAEYQAAERIALGIAPFVTFASDDTMQAYYGVTERQAAASGHRAFAADAGPERYGARVQLMARLSSRWGLVAMAEFSGLLGDAKDSPLTEKDQQLTEAGVFLMYQF